MTRSWKKISNKTLFNHPRLNLSEDRVRLPNGQETDYLLFDNYPDYSTVIAMDVNGKILMLKEYAYPVNQTLLQFPEGDSKPNETIEVTASRELAEEAGLAAKSLTIIGYNLHHHRRATAKNVVVLAEELSNIQAEGDAEEAGITLHWLSEKDIWQKIANNEIIQKNTLAAWASFQAYQRAKR